MSWSAETRCLYCDGKLPLYRKLTSGQFCSAKHAKAYWQEQEQLAVERLHQTHDSIRAYRPAGALDAILGPGAENSPYYKSITPDHDSLESVSPDHVSLEQISVAGSAHSAPPSPAFEIVTPAAPVLPTRAEVIARHASNIDKVATPGFLTYERPLAADWHHYPELPKFAGDDWEPLTPPISPWIPTSDLPQLSTSVAAAGLLDCTYVEFVAKDEAIARPLTPFEVVAIIPAARPSSRIELFAAPVTPELEMSTVVEIEPEQDAGPVVEAVVQPVQEEVAIQQAEAVVDVAAAAPVELVVPAVPTPASPEVVILASSPDEVEPPMAAFVAPNVPESLPVAITPRGAIAPANSPIPRHVARFEHDAIAELADAYEASWAAASVEHGKLLAMPPFGALNTPAGVRSNPEAVEIAPKVAKTSARISGSVAGVQGPRVAGLVRLPAGEEQSLLRSREPKYVAIASQPTNFTSSNKQPAYNLATDTVPSRWKLASGIRYPVVARNQAISIAHTEASPVSSELLAIEMPCDTGSPVVEPSAAWLLPVPYRPGAPCAMKIVADTRNVARIDVAGPEPNIPPSRLTAVQGTLEPQSRFGFLASAARNALEPQFVWTHAVDFWRNAPRDLKLLVFAIPVLLALALHPSLPKFRVKPTANVATKAPSGINSAVREHLQVVRETVASRAGVELTEDFRTGLDSWQSRGDLSAAWSFDSNGFVRPGMLALYQPSMNLKDYDMSFLGLIDKRAMNFVVRAQDFDNYYVVKIMILKPGPLPTLGITRYAVIDGKPQNRKDVLAPINAQPDMLYRVNLNVHDDTFLLQMQGKIVDSWSETRLTHGGVGFFSASGEESRLRWVQVTHQYDMLGRLCAYLAPYNMPTRNGSW